MGNLNVDEIFNSISGEVGPFPQGSLTTFLRLYGCNMKCSYCDTIPIEHYLKPIKSVEEIISFNCASTDYLCITGGEPLVQKSSVEELISMLDPDIDIWIETNGTIRLIPDLNYVMDYKWERPPLVENYSLLSDRSIIKFLISSEKDFENFIIVAEIIAGFTLKPITLAIGCLWEGGITYKELLTLFNQKYLRIRRIKEQGVKMVINVQMHKYVNLK